MRKNERMKRELEKLGGRKRERRNKERNNQRKKVRKI